MTAYTKQLKASRKAKVTRMTAIVGDGRRSLSNAERSEFDRLDNDVRNIDVQVANAKATDFNYRGESAGNLVNEVRTLGGVKRDKRYRRTPEDEAFTRYLRGGPEPEFRAPLDVNGMSTVGVEPGIAGPTGYSAGYTIPQGFFKTLVIALKAYGGLANDFRLVETPTGNPMPFPVVDPTAIKASYITELQQLGFGGDSAGTDYQFGQGMLNAFTLVSGVILASVQLIQDSAFDVDSFVSDRVGEAIGRKLAAEAFSGSGATALLGINTALAARPTAGTVGSAITATGGWVLLATGATYKKFDASSPTELASNCLSPSSIIAMVEAVDPAYFPNSKFYMNAQQAFNLRAVSDANSRPLLNFQNGLTADDVRNGNYSQGSAVAEILGFPCLIDNSISNLTASTVSGPIFGDLSKAMMLRMVSGDGTRIQTMKLTERYADFLQVGYLGYMRADARSSDLRAAVTVKCAAT